MSTMQPTSSPLPTWLWLWTPITVVLAQIGAKAISEDFYRDWMRSEYGLIETLTVLALLTAIFFALGLYRLRGRVTSRLFGPFALIMALGCFYFAGEEASWGQHWIGYATPESIAARNDQGEFNLHNDPALEAFLDQGPRALLTLAALVGGILAPLLWARKRRIDFHSRSPFDWVWPTYVCLPAAVVVVFITLPAKALKTIQGDVPYLLEISPGETKEFAIALFLMLYLMNLYRELRQTSA